jgi:hypothetical protein
MAKTTSWFAFAVGVALTILAAMTWAKAQPSSPIYPVYQPVLWPSSNELPQSGAWHQSWLWGRPMASTSKCLAQSNKSPERGTATKERHRQRAGLDASGG